MDIASGKGDEVLTLHRQLCVARNRIEVLESALKRTEDHLRSWVETSPLDRTTETDAIFYCNSQIMGVCPICGGDCSSANPPMSYCPMRDGVTK